MRGLATVALALGLVAVLLATLGQAEDPVTSSTSPAPQTYMGVDANDPEAVRQRQKEIGHEKWKEMFGDVDINNMDFGPDFDSNREAIKQAVSETINSAVEKFASLFKPRARPSTERPTSEKPASAQ